MAYAASITFFSAWAEAKRNQSTEAGTYMSEQLCTDNAVPRSSVLHSIGLNSCSIQFLLCSRKATRSSPPSDLATQSLKTFTSWCDQGLAHFPYAVMLPWNASQFHGVPKTPRVAHSPCVAFPKCPHLGSWLYFRNVPVPGSEGVHSNKIRTLLRARQSALLSSFK